MITSVLSLQQGKGPRKIIVENEEFEHIITLYFLSSVFVSAETKLNYNYPIFLDLSVFNVAPALTVEFHSVDSAAQFWTGLLPVMSFGALACKSVKIKLP